LSSGADGARELADGRLLLDEPAAHVARLTIANPDKRNALDHAILDAIAQTVPALDARCLLLTAVGQTFSAGYDIGGMPEETFAEEAEKLVAHPFAAAIEALESYPYPSVAALNGHAIGVPRTRELFLVGRNIPAEEALAWGLVNAVHPPDELPGAGLELAIEIAGNAPLALSGNKTVIRRLLEARAALDPEVERELVELRRACFVSEDFREGVRAFAEKRAPQWRAR